MSTDAPQTIVLIHLRRATFRRARRKEVADEALTGPSRRAGRTPVAASGESA